MKRFWKIQNLSRNEAELLVYGDILPERDYEGNNTVLREIIAEIETLKTYDSITIRINSMGGDVFSAHAIYTHLMMLNAHVTVIIDGIAASAASVIAMAGDIIVMPRNALMMIHDPMLGLCGYYNASELEAVIEPLEKVKSAIVTTYQNKSKMAAVEIETLMSKETWMTADDALAAGFIDEVLDFESSAIGDASVANTSQKHFRNMPKIFAAKNRIESRKGGNMMLFNNKLIDVKTPINSASELLSAYPDFCNELVVVERERIKGIEEIANSIDPILVKSAKFDNIMDAKELALVAMQQANMAAKAYMVKAVEDSAASGTMDVGVAIKPEAPAKANTFSDKLAELTAQLNKRMYK